MYAKFNDVKKVAVADIPIHWLYRGLEVQRTPRAMFDASVLEARKAQEYVKSVCDFYRGKQFAESTTTTKGGGL